MFSVEREDLKFVCLWGQFSSKKEDLVRLVVPDRNPSCKVDLLAHIVPLIPLSLSTGSKPCQRFYHSWRCLCLPTPIWCHRRGSSCHHLWREGGKRLQNPPCLSCRPQKRWCKKGPSTKGEFPGLWRIQVSQGGNSRSSWENWWRRKLQEVGGRKQQRWGLEWQDLNDSYELEDIQWRKFYSQKVKLE